MKPDDVNTCRKIGNIILNTIYGVALIAAVAAVIYYKIT